MDTDSSMMSSPHWKSQEKEKKKKVYKDYRNCRESQNQPRRKTGTAPTVAEDYDFEQGSSWCSHGEQGQAGLQAKRREKKKELLWFGEIEIG